MQHNFLWYHFFNLARWLRKSKGFVTPSSLSPTSDYSHTGLTLFLQHTALIRIELGGRQLAWQWWWCCLACKCSIRFYFLFLMSEFGVATSRVEEFPIRFSENFHACVAWQGTHFSFCFSVCPQCGLLRRIDISILCANSSSFQTWAPLLHWVKRGPRHWKTPTTPSPLTLFPGRRLEAISLAWT